MGMGHPAREPGWQGGHTYPERRRVTQLMKLQEPMVKNIGRQKKQKCYVDGHKGHVSAYNMKLKLNEMIKRHESVSYFSLHNYDVQTANAGTQALQGHV